MQENSHIGRSSIKWDLLIAGALSLGGLLARLPYVALVPVFTDGVIHTMYALSIQPGKFMPLKGLDAYSGPLFAYLLAGWLRLFGSTSAMPRLLMAVMGALTVGLTFLLARALGLSRPWAALPALLMAANPHHILINSHISGATYTIPLFSTAFMLALALGVRRGSGVWLVAAGVLLGMALQGNPVPALMLPGVAVWFLAQRKLTIGPRTRWPYLAAAGFVLGYAPVIFYNLRYEWVGVAVAGTRSYVWQPNLSLPVYLQNLGRLVLQLCHQAGGVLTEGDETLGTLAGPQLLLSAWALAGLIYTARLRQPVGLPTLAVGSQALIMPWLSSLYGVTSATRFTNHLTPLMCVAMGVLAEGAWSYFRAQNPNRVESTRWLAGALLVALSLWPLVSLARYYQRAETRGETNAHYFAFFDEFAQQWRGEKIYLSETLDAFNPTEYLLAANHVPYTMMNFGRLMERLATGQEAGRVTLILSKDDVPRARSQADLIVWDSPAIQAARKMGYGVYTIADARQVRKPIFVLAEGTPLAPSVRATQVNLADQLAVVGYEPSADNLVPGAKLTVAVYWKAIGAMSDDYTGFIHLVGPDGRLVTQDDHELGRGLYRTTSWQPDEMVRERYELTLPSDAPAGAYLLRVGAYSYPSVTRLPVRSASTPTQDDLVTLGTVQVRP